MDQINRRVWENAVRIHGTRSVVVGSARGEEYDTITDQDWNLFSNLIIDKTVVLEYGAGIGRISQRAADVCLSIIAYEPIDYLRSILSHNLISYNNALIVDQNILRETGLLLTTIFSCNVVPHLILSDVVELFEFAGNNLSPGGTLVLDYVSSDCDSVQEVGPNILEGVLPIYKYKPDTVRTLASMSDLAINLSTRHPNKPRIVDRFIKDGYRCE